MELFKLLGKIVIENHEANSALVDTSEKAKETAETVSESSKKTQDSNKSTGSSWGSLKAKVAEYKAQGMSTSQAWRQATQDMKSSTEDAGNGMSNAFKKVGAAIATYLTVSAIKDFGLACINAAADANAMESQFSQVFGDLEGQASASLSSLADEAGITENRMKGSFTKIAAFAKTTGMDTESALALSERAMAAVADSAAFYDRSLEETTESLQSFLKGNYENDAALGLSCTETTRNAAANELYGKSFQDLSESQKQLTLLKMVEDANAASGALGQAARESDTWTNVTGNLKQSWTDFQAVIGSNVLPLAVDAVKGMVSVVEDWTAKLPELINWCKEHETIMSTIGILIATVTAAIIAYNIAQNAATIATTIATAATTAWGAVMAFVTSPVTLVVLAIGALIAAGVALYQNWDKVSEFCSEMWTKIKEIWANIKESVSEKIEEIKTAISEKFEAAKEKVSEIFNAVKETISTAWETVKNVVKLGLMFIVELISAAFQLITLPFRFIWENCKETILSAWDAIKTAVSNALDAIKTTISNVWNAIVNFLSPILNTIKSTITTAWNSIKSAISTALNAIKSVVSSVWNGIKSVVSSVLNSIKSVVSSVWNSIKSTTTSIWNGIKGAISSVWNGIKSAVSAAVNGVKSTVTSVFNGIKSVATSVWNSIKSAITTPINAAKDAVKTAIDKIKGFFSGLKLELPKIKLPHFKLTGEFSLKNMTVPKLSVEWYAKAMNNPMIMNSPTIFGYNSETGKYRVGGEAGSEVVSGTNTLMNMIGKVVEGKTAEQNERIIAVLVAILEAITGGNAELLRALLAGQKIVLNEREVGRTVRTYA